MKLIEALTTAQSPFPDGARPFRVFLGCGFTPLHLQTFLLAHLRNRMPEYAPEIRTGLFGDLVGNVERLKSSEADVVAVVLEWTDFDQRLGIRQLGGWRHEQLSDITSSVKSAADRIRRALDAVSRHSTTVLSLPTLPFPPAFTTRPVQSAAQEVQLHSICSQLAETLVSCSGIRIVNPQRMAEVSAPSSRYDIKSDLATGFPYTLNHGSAVAELMSSLIENRPPLKGLITDLDDTLWSGIVGEDGVNGISWDLDGHSQMHGVYQQHLASMASSGVLIGVASKNDPAVVDQAWQRSDLLLPREAVFPLEVHWGRKSDSVRRILNTWNIAPDAAVFIDDSPAEIAELQAAFPGIHCRAFPKNDPPAIWNLLYELRDLFGKSAISKEDSLRLRSIRGAAAWRDQGGAGQSQSDEFLQSAEARILFEYGRAEDLRALELLNKTNQFNLNGRRYTDAEWCHLLADPSAFLLTAAYDDKYGALGKIAVLVGAVNGGTADVKSWVMSCRAFSRRIEHQCVRYLFEDLAVERINFQFVRTDRNGPIQDFLSSYAGKPLGETVSFMKQDFFAKVPQLFHRVEVGIHA